ncbi:phage Gp37/Gp68 family protein [Paenibacillus sp. GCM10012303]|uniref:phage Gp37/Gp68 family protein n=1 Tax=Paenibacillus sp. GCM10012303 TaxID=3317340 RepID=UPI003606C4D7
MGETSIEWTDRTWNPLRGCSKVSEGCRNCYAIRVAHRFGGEGMPYEGLTQPGPGGPNWTGKVTLVPDALESPLRWRKQQRVFVNSMSDLFHESVDEKYIAKVFGIMCLSQQHTFQVLTKRPERMARLLNSEDFQMHTGWFASQAIREYGLDRSKFEYLPDWPLPNVWLGVSVENQKAADDRIPLLLQTPAAVRFLSCEPLLGPVKLPKSAYEFDEEYPEEGSVCKLDWVIAGGESGPGARPMHPDWTRSLRDQCQAAGVSFFFKQWGEWLPVHPDRKSYEYSSPGHKCAEIDGTRFFRIGKLLAGRQLDDREWNEFPEAT